MKLIKLLTLLVFAFVLYSGKPVTTVTLVHTGYTTVWHKTLKYPIQVEWWNTKARLHCPDSKLQRKDKFAPDPLLVTQTDLANDYIGSGLDRGHMCPAADNTCDSTLLVECFYFSNIAPQYHALNAGDWLMLENRVRELSLSYDSVKVWCGSYGVAKKIGSVTVPTHCWKVIWIKKTNKWESYLFANTTADAVGLDKLKVTKAKIEGITGLKFNAK